MQKYALAVVSCSSAEGGGERRARGCLYSIASAGTRSGPSSGPLKAVRCEDGERIKPGRIYVTRPDLHLLVQKERVRVLRGPKENRHRPAVDTLFRSAAVVYGPRVIGVVLSRALNDGTVGLAAIKRRGGVAVVQDPDNALFSGMPQSALEHVKVDYCLPLPDIAPLLARIVHEEVLAEEGAYPVPDDMELEDRMARLDPATPENVEKLGQPFTFTCPECDGPLWEIRDEEVLRFRCRVGHAYTAENMLAEKSEALEGALWAPSTPSRKARRCRRGSLLEHAPAGRITRRGASRSVRESPKSRRP
jgi:two-component system chemotaxis response regulator CheB